MTRGQTSGAEEVRWDLGTIYQGTGDPRIADDEAQIDRLVEAFQAHRQRFESGAVEPAAVAEILGDLERIRFLADRMVTYAALAASADQEDPKRTALYARLEERYRRWSAELVFAELGLRRLPADRLARLIESPDLQRYRHFLEYQASLAPHTLLESEEQIVLKKNIAGRDAQVRFREEYAARMDFGTLTVDGEERPMTMASLISLQESPDPDLRFRARHRLNETFGAQLPVFAFLYGNVVKDHGIEAELRSYRSPIDVENIPNEIPGEVVSNLVELSHQHQPVLHRYYRWKAEKLGLPRLRSCDLLAPLPGSDPDPIPWETARRSVEGSFLRLDPTFAKEIRRFFDERRLDAAARRGKRGGAFCAPVPGGRPYILMSYTGTLGSLVTLAHELGHGIHFLLSGQEQTYLQAYSMSKVIAETASEFGECLLRDHLLETSEDPALRRKVLVSEVERFISVIFRQLFFTEFEMAVHEKAAREPLSAEGLSDLWESMAREHYGPNVELLENDRCGWAIVGHFVFNPFYCYSYALSQVVVLALYRKWKREGNRFLPHFLGILRGGWSGTPVDLLARAGIDLRSREVLEDAMQEFEERIRAAQEVIG